MQPLHGVKYAKDSLQSHCRLRVIHTALATARVRQPTGNDASEVDRIFEKDDL